MTKLIQRLLRRGRTLDLAGVEVLAKEQVGRTRFRTPEGFLYCKDVVVARTGEMLYGPGEVPVEPGADGVIRITRDADTLFDSEALASYQGKPITDEHPPEEVTPENWAKYAKGIVLNPRRGTGDDSELMLCDFLVTDKGLIEQIEANKRETSNGYEADYQQLSRGYGKQLHIIGNHIALVARGRCGPRCSIGDHQPTEEEPSMADSKNRVPLKEAVRKAFNDAADKLAETLGDDESEGKSRDTHVHIHVGKSRTSDSDDMDDEDDDKSKTKDSDDPNEARFKALEEGQAKTNDTLAKIATTLDGLSKGKTKDGDDEDDDKSKTKDSEEEEDKDKTKTTDSAALQTGFQQVLADAEILVPGLRLPTFDAALPRTKTVDAMCSLRRSVLTQLQATRDGITLLGELGEAADTDYSKADCADLAGTFKAAAALKKANTNKRTTDGANKIADDIKALGSSKMPTPAEMNKAAADFWKSQGVH